MNNLRQHLSLIRSGLGLLTAASLALCLPSFAPAADSPANWTKAADNHILAQKLVNELMAQNADLVVVGLHVTPPGSTVERMVASNLDRIGKEDDADDIAVFSERKTILCPNAKEPHKFEVQVPLMDVNGVVIGTCGFVFRYNAGDDELELHRRALVLRAWLKERTPSLDALLRPSA
jgi:iron complex outermembrane receptor protein